ncbi:hypothetical protein M0208_03145 [Sphingomonas sp. SUN019]|uniref:CC0125/CC1285 family lipoprotein n=1 Tax=Sphingomonas sp. SUN019 TaxID=2937788 RepID=UPI00216457DA|nr:hypothetical protein [Sphingomonas sp. SUN019]UVO49555.1 hypothetical protein M0208_03145 [Sphingomonas sp. SUN019]
MTTFRLGRGVILATVAGGALLVAGCATPTTYRPATGSGFSRTGYTDIRIEPNRYRVTFAGNTITDRDIVERYLLFRAAELTLQNGYDYFVMVDRDTDRQARTYSTGFGGGGFGGGFGNGYWGPSWGFYGRGYGWRRFGGGFGYGGFGGFGGFNDFDVRTIDRYEASAEIVMRRGAPARDDVRAFNARAVTESIGPSIVLPKP